jgi:hypothetical protein
MDGGDEMKLYLYRFDHKWSVSLLHKEEPAQWDTYHAHHWSVQNADANNTTVVCDWMVKAFFGLTDEQLRDDVLVCYEVKAGAGHGFDECWGDGCVFLCNRTIRYGRDEENSEAQTHLKKFNHLFVQGDSYKEQLENAVKFLLQREAQREEGKDES